MIRDLPCLDSRAAGHRHLVRCGSAVKAKGGPTGYGTCEVGMHRASVLGVGVCVIHTASSRLPHICGGKIS